MIIAGKTEDLVQGLDFARILCVHAPNATSNALEFYQKAIYYYAHGSHRLHGFFRLRNVL